MKEVQLVHPFHLHYQKHQLRVLKHRPGLDHLEIVDPVTCGKTIPPGGSLLFFAFFCFATTPIIAAKKHREYLTY